MSTGAADTAAPPGRRVRRRTTTGPAHRIAALAAQALGMSDATFALFDGNLQGVMASTRPPASGGEPVAARLSEAVAASGQQLSIADLSVSDHPAVVGTGATGAFVGSPLLATGESVVGVLYLTDPAPRAFAAEDLDLLDDFAAVAADHLELTRRANDLEAPSERGAAALVRAIGSGEILPFYQPIVDLATGRLVGVEALARWQQPSGAFDDPAVFIPLAERSALIVDLDRSIIRQALHDLAHWRIRHPELRLSVNLSGRHLDRDDWVSAVTSLVERAGVDPSAVTLELTETARPDGLGFDMQRIVEVRRIGFQVWFDDFGSGWAALQELLNFPLDGIKIDRTFAAQLGRHVDNTVVKAMANAANGLGLKVTMEGVETPEQAAIATELGCHYGQGYLWSRPLPATDIGALLAGPDGEMPRLG